MGRSPCCDKTKVKRGPWSPEEDSTLRTYIEKYGTGGNWIALPHKAGLRRCGKSCRLRWLNYLRPDIKHGSFTDEEDYIILTLYHNIGSRWSVIASHLPGRTDNDVKNHWNTKLKKKLLAGKNTNIFHNSPNCHISPNNLMHFGSSPLSEQELTSFDTNYSTNIGNKNYEQSPSVPEVLLSEYPTQFPLPRLMEVQEHGKIAYPTTTSSLCVSSSSQEVSSLSPSLEYNNYTSWSGNGGGQNDGFLMGSMGPCPAYDLQNGFHFQENFQEKINGGGPYLADSPCSSLLANILSD